MSVDRQRYEREVKSMYVDLIAAVNENGGVECTQAPEAFFPEEIKDLISREIAVVIAKDICNRCPVIKLCREYALYERPSTGIWGSLTADERSSE